MSAVREREEAMRMLLAEVAPNARYDVEWTSGQRACTAWDGGQPEHDDILKASMLASLRLDGPGASVRCPAHTSLALTCDRVPVSWALLGHTCGRAS